jgi:hypothetical protein
MPLDIDKSFDGLVALLDAGSPTDEFRSTGRS